VTRDRELLTEGLAPDEAAGVAVSTAGRSALFAGITVCLALLGLVLVLGRLHGPGPMRWLVVAYIEVFRGTPLLLQIYFIYFGLAQQLGIQLSAGLAAVIALGLNYAANEAEHYRAGIQGVPAGQVDAGLALGMSRFLVLRRVVLPQALRLCLPSVTNDFIAMFKDSSIVSVIAPVPSATTTWQYSERCSLRIGLRLKIQASRPTWSTAYGDFIRVSWPESCLPRKE
jgi:polar amino acid transport system substrate-binding protein